jgi:hypothetical protein
MNAAVWFNGEWIGDGGSFEEPVARNWNRPLIFRLPAAAWRNDRNELLVRLRVYPGFGHMTPVAVGPTALLQPDHDRRFFAQISLSQVAAGGDGAGDAVRPGAVVDRPPRHRLPLVRRAQRRVPRLRAEQVRAADPDVGAGLVVAGPYRRRRRDFLRHAVRASGARGAPDPRRGRDGRGARALRHLVRGLGPAPAGPLQPLDARIATLGSLYAVGWLLLQWRRRSTMEVGAYALGLLALFAAGLYDQLLNSLLFPLLWREGFYVLSLAMPALLLGLMFQLGLRSVRAMHGLRVANDTLEARVALAGAEIEATYSRERRLLAERSAGQERERIYRDLHDNLGARAAEPGLRLRPTIGSARWRATPCRRCGPWSPPARSSPRAGRPRRGVAARGRAALRERAPGARLVARGRRQALGAAALPARADRPRADLERDRARPGPADRGGVACRAGPSRAQGRRRRQGHADERGTGGRDRARGRSRRVRRVVVRGTGGGTEAFVAVPVPAVAPTERAT